jgi:hypothetical protein
VRINLCQLSSVAVGIVLAAPLAALAMGMAGCGYGYDYAVCWFHQLAPAWNEAREARVDPSIQLCPTHHKVAAGRAACCHYGLVYEDIPHSA